MDSKQDREPPPDPKPEERVRPASEAAAEQPALAPEAAGDENGRPALGSGPAADRGAARLEMEARIAALEEERSFYVEQLQRARADFDNFRKRTNSERAREQRRTRVEILRALLPIDDGLQQALQSRDAAPESAILGAGATPAAEAPLREGVRMLAEKFGRVLELYSIDAIGEVGEPFDPSWHEAVIQEESSTVPEGHFLAVLETGYRCGEDLLRPARVKVAKAPGAGGAGHPNGLAGPATEDVSGADGRK